MTPSVLTAITIAVGAAATLVLGVLPGPVLDLAGPCGRLPQVSPHRSTGLALPVTDARSPSGWVGGWTSSSRRWPEHVRSRAGFVTEAASPPDGGRRQAFPAAAGAARGRDRLAPRRPTRWSPPPASSSSRTSRRSTTTTSWTRPQLRRGAVSANARWDNHVAILTGDFLFSKSSELTAELGADAVRIQAQTFTKLVEGQILETVQPGPDEDPLAHYLDVVAGKTGSLIATSARYGARFGGATSEVEEALTAYGEIVGSAFQLSDDILDIASDHDVSGKTPGTDLREGVPTLPVLMARASADPADARLLELLDGDLTDDGRHAEALALLRRHPALEQARAYVVAQAAEAKDRLSVVPDGPVRRALEAFADVVATRSS